MTNVRLLKQGLLPCDVIVSIDGKQVGDVTAVSEKEEWGLKSVVQGARQ